MNEVMHVLSVGSTEEGQQVGESLQRRHRCRLMIAGNYQELSLVQQSVRCDVAVVHGSLVKRELKRCCSWVRRAWPEARILLIARPPVEVEELLYDERLTVRPSAGTLLSHLERMAGEKFPRS
jgi:hypothetical protein